MLQEFNWLLLVTFWSKVSDVREECFVILIHLWSHVTMQFCTFSLSKKLQRGLYNGYDIDIKVFHNTFNVYIYNLFSNILSSENIILTLLRSSDFYISDLFSL